MNPSWMIMATMNGCSMNLQKKFDTSSLIDGYKYQVKLKKGGIFNRCFWHKDIQEFHRGNGIIVRIYPSEVEWAEKDTDPYDY